MKPQRRPSCRIVRPAGAHRQAGRAEPLVADACPSAADRRDTPRHSADGPSRNSAKRSGQDRPQNDVRASRPDGAPRSLCRRAIARTIVQRLQAPERNLSSKSINFIAEAASPLRTTDVAFEPVFWHHRSSINNHPPGHSQVRVSQQTSLSRAAIGAVVLIGVFTVSTLIGRRRAGAGRK